MKDLLDLFSFLTSYSIEENMNKIYNYRLSQQWFSPTRITVPGGSEVVGFHRHHNGNLAVWINHGSTAPVTRVFMVVPTGEDYEGDYVGFYSEKGTVFHLVEVTNYGMSRTNQSSYRSTVTTGSSGNTTVSQPDPINEPVSLDHQRDGAWTFYFQGEEDDKPYLRIATPFRFGYDERTGRQYMMAVSYKTDDKDGGVRRFYLDEVINVRFENG